jgi:hypothetical protein
MSIAPVSHWPGRRRGTSESGNAYLWGCAALLAIGIFIILGVFLAAYIGISAYRKYTSTEPIVLPPVEATVEEIDGVVERVDTFLDKLDKGEAREPLVLSEQDVNILIQHHPEMEGLQDFVYVTLNGDQITGQLNVPLEFIPGLEKRYFTGVADFDLEFQHDRLELYVTDAEVNGEPVPEKAMKDIRKQNLAEDAERDHPDLQKHLDRLESITVADGKITITPKQD